MNERTPGRRWSFTGAAGLAIGAGVAGIVTGIAGQVAGVLTVLVTLVPLLLLVLRHETPAAARSVNIRLGLPLRHLGTTMAAVLPAWTYFVALGLFLGVHASSSIDGVPRPDMALWGFGLSFSAGGVVMLFALHRWRTLWLAEVVVPLVTVVLALVSWMALPDASGMLGMGVLLGLAAPAAAGLLGLGSGGSLALSAVTAVTTGLLLSWLATGPAGYGAALFLSMLAVAGAVVAMLGVYRRLIGSAPESERR